MLALEQVCKSFGRVLVADRLSLAVGDGEAVGIVGPNGAGKSTLFSIISGDLPPDEGDVHLDGVRVTGLGAAARCRAGVGRTYQVPRPFVHMTAYENVLVAAEQGGSGRGGLGPGHGASGWGRRSRHGHTRRDARAVAMSVLDETGLAAVANRPAGRLPLLSRKRLELARALATEPRLLLLDEVAGGLSDPEVDELVAIVRARHAAGLTVVWVEHVVHALTRSVDRLLCLAGGRFVADGAPDEVLASAAVREVYLGVDVELAAEAGEVDEADDPGGAGGPEAAGRPDAAGGLDVAGGLGGPDAAAGSVGPPPGGTGGRP